MRLTAPCPVAMLVTRPLQHTIPGSAMLGKPAMLSVQAKGRVRWSRCELINNAVTLVKHRQKHRLSVV